MDRNLVFTDSRYGWIFVKFEKTSPEKIKVTVTIADDTLDTQYCIISSFAFASKAPYTSPFLFDETSHAILMCCDFLCAKKGIRPYVPLHFSA